MTRRWVLKGQEGFETSLEYQEGFKMPTADDLASDEVLVQIRAAGLSYRELAIASPNGGRGPLLAPVVPGCDGAGVVKAVGMSVRLFRPGDRVITYFAPDLVRREGDDASPGMAEAPSMLGHGTDGTFLSDGIFPESALVRAPESLGWLTAASLTSNWTAAWNVLFGLQSAQAGAGTWVLVQGTGGIGIATLQLAVSAGATVVATTSTEDKATRLRELGAAYVVNYRTNPDKWGELARNLTPDKRGFDIIADVGGNQTLRHSLKAVRINGTVAVIGQVGGPAEPVPMSAALMHTCIVRGVLAGSRTQLRQVVRYIDEKAIVPAVDDVVFELAEAKDAYRRLQEKRHFSKVVIRVDHLDSRIEG